MRIKHAYNTLLTSESRRKYDSESRASDYSYSTAGGYKRAEDEEFYGFGIYPYRSFILFVIMIQIPTQMAKLKAQMMC